MEMIELSQNEIDLLLSLLEQQDLEETSLPISDLIRLHSKLSDAKTY